MGKRATVTQVVHTKSRDGFIEDRTKTVDKLVNDDPDTAHRLRDTGNP